jgi:acetoin utilization deacetylase AcuC-like enzyme
MLSVIYSDEFLEHKTGLLHPEKPERLSAIATALKASAFANQLEWRSPTPVDARVIASINRVHTLEHIKTVEHLAKRGGGYLDPDTPVSPRSYDVAMLAVSAWLDGVEEVVATVSQHLSLLVLLDIMPKAIAVWVFAYFLMRRSLPIMP